MTNQEMFLQTLREILARAEAGQLNINDEPVVMPPAPEAVAPPLLDYNAADINDYIDMDTQLFVRDFWMRGRVGAMVGASVKEYNQANIILGAISTGYRPRETYVLGPDVPDKLWNETLTSPGSNGWNPAGAEYRFDPELKSHEVFQSWIAAGCPKQNKYGDWSQSGRPIAEYNESWANWGSSRANLNNGAEREQVPPSEGRRNRNNRNNRR